jgi:hypothetical protein
MLHQSYRHLNPLLKLNLPQNPNHFQNLALSQPQSLSLNLLQNQLSHLLSQNLNQSHCPCQNQNQSQPQNHPFHQPTLTMSQNKHQTRNQSHQAQSKKVRCL